MTDRATSYAKDVISGGIAAGPYVRGACQRHIHDLENAESRGLYYDEHAAAETIAFFEEVLYLNGGQFEGMPFLLLGWQDFVIGSLFGWKRKSDNMRRFRVSYIEGPKGCGKSPMASGIGLKGLIADNESRAEVYAAATYKDQAMVLFRDAVAIYEQSPEINSRLVASGVGEKCWNLSHLNSGSFFRVISSEKKGQSGPRPHMVLLDEIHEHRDGTVIEMLRAGFKFRRQPLSFMITNPLALDTPIPTPTGWSTMGDLRVGDQIFNDDGQPCKVDGVSEVMIGRKCYRIIFDDGSEIIADAEHLWETTIKRPYGSHGAHAKSMAAECRNNKERRKKGEDNKLIKCQCGCGEYIEDYDSAGRPRYYISGHNNKKSSKTKIRSTQEIKDTLYHGKNGLNHEIKLSSPLQLPEIKLPIPSYVLGCWLGDGNSKDSAIVVADQDYEILEQIKKEGVTIGNRRAISSSGPNLGLFGLGITGTYRRDSLHSILRKEGLLKNKHIPQSYLRASFRQRLSLLQGLMDTDGSIVPWSGKCVFTQSKHNLILQVEELIHSLGMKCNVNQSISKLNGKTFDRWDIHFWPPWDLDVFRLSRKNQHHYARHSRKRSSGSRWIREIIPVESVPVKCITIDAESHLYLAGKSMIPTHNSGHDKTSVCWEYHDMGVKIACEQLENDEFFSYICALDDEDIVDDRYLEDETLWPKVNPSLDAGIPGYDYIRSQVKEARGMPSKMATVKRLCFCQWTEAENPAISKEAWMACQDKGCSDGILVGRRCWGGLDLSAVVDLTSFALMFEPSSDDPFWRLRVWFWMPGIGIVRKSELDHVPYVAWRDSGHITAIDRKTIEYEFVISDIVEICSRFDVQKIAFDRWNKKNFDKEIERLGVTLPELIEFGQGFQSMSPAIKIFETKLIESTMRHDGNPCLTWCASNVVAVSDAAENKKYDKSRSGGRIDGVIASVMACGILEESAEEASAYDGLTVEQIVGRMKM
jgi:phage terminase large subunit-like protein